MLRLDEVGKRRAAEACAVAGRCTVTPLGETLWNALEQASDWAFFFGWLYGNQPDDRDYSEDLEEC